MARNPWLALDAATRPRDRARQTRVAWERFLGEGRVEAVRAPVADSWRRSLAAGVNPLRERAAPTLADANEASARWREHPLAAAGLLIRDCLGPLAVDADSLVVVSDEYGMLLWIEGPDHLRRDAAESMNFVEGAEWSERGTGTNAIGTALVADHAVQVFASEHFNEAVQPWSCSAAPIHDPDTGRLLGIVDITGKAGSAHPETFGVALATALAVEAHLRGLLSERHAQLRARYDHRVAAAGSPALLATPSGRVIAGDNVARWVGADRLDLPQAGGELILPSGRPAFAEPVGHGEAYVVHGLGGRGLHGQRPRLHLEVLGPRKPSVKLDNRPVPVSPLGIEILVLLAAHPDGMSGQELAADLYGDEGHPGGVRVQMFRLRKILGPWIDAGPYRLALEVISDAAQVRGMLERGAVRDAAQHYAGPLLAHSEAPGIVREREELDGWLRNAVVTADDVEALWAWAQCDSGHDDLIAWKRLLTNLDYTDPRRSLAVSRVGALRAALQLSS